MNDNLKLGEKLRNYRKRAGISQLELEIKIDSSTVTISRIENGEVNPTKETLLKIVDALDIKYYEASDIFNLDTNELSRLVKIAQKLNTTLNLNEVLQNSVNELVFELGLLGSIIFLVEGDTVYAKTITQTGYTRFITDILKVPFSSLKGSITKDRDNYIVRTIVEKKPFYSLDVYNFAIGAVNKIIAGMIQKFTNHKCAISLPIIFKGESIGTILFSKDYVDNFKSEYAILESYTNIIGNAIFNAKQFESLKLEISRLKNE